MSIITKLILKEWLKFFFASVFILLLLMTIASLISGLLRSNVSATDVILNYIIELPGHMSKIFPVSCLVASLFSINKLKNRNELTAIFASGHSRKLYIMTIFQVSLVVALVQFFTTSYIQPFFKSNKDFFITDSSQKFRNLKAQGIWMNTLATGRIWFKSKSYFMSFTSFDKQNNSLNNIEIFENGTNYLLSKKIIAKKAQFKDGKWTFIDGIVSSNLSQQRFPKVEKFQKLDYQLKETDQSFKEIEADITTLNIVGLAKYIGNLRDAGININEYLVIFLDKFSSAILCVIMAIMAAIPVFNPNRRNSSLGKNVAFVFVFVIAYWLIYSFTFQLGKNSKIDPYLSCFIIPVLFSSYLAMYFFRHKKLR